MKRKRPKPIDWSKVAWTPFESCVLPTDRLNLMDPPVAIYRNSRYQVTVYEREVPHFGVTAHLSFKTHDRAAWHDWRDMMRIKNEICGPECDAVEVYPAESKLVDCANQYHLIVFRDYKLPFGFQERLVGDGELVSPSGSVSRQRPWPDGERPADCLSPEQYQARVDAVLAKQVGEE